MFRARSQSRHEQYDAVAAAIEARPAIRAGVSVGVSGSALREALVFPRVLTEAAAELRLGLVVAKRVELRRYVEPDRAG